MNIRIYFTYEYEPTEKDFVEILCMMFNYLSKEKQLPTHKSENNLS